MNILQSKTYQQSLKEASELVDLGALKGKRILITGATGLICSAIVDLLAYANVHNDLGAAIYAAGRSREKTEARFSALPGSGVIPVVYDALKAVDFPFHVDYLIHGAGNASPEKYVSQPVDTMLANILGLSNLLRFAGETGVKKSVYISSSEVYGVLPSAEPLAETTYGSVDILGSRASYPVAKRAAETICVSYANQYGLDVSIVRPGHIYGPTAQSSDNRVSSLFARQAAGGENLIMKSTGAQIRSYCHCIDCATAILTVMLKGTSKEAYNISNPNSIVTIRQMAEAFARHAGVELILELPTDAEKAAFNPMNNSSLRSNKLEALGWRGLFDGESGFAQTIAVLRELAAEAQ